jgi:hypothetical protein
MFNAKLLVCTLSVLAACTALAQPATIPLSTPVEQLARDALGTQPGMAVAGAWRDGKPAAGGGRCAGRVWRRP